MLLKLSAEQVGRLLMEGCTEEIIDHEELGKAIRSQSIGHLSDKQLGALLHHAWSEDIIEATHVFANEDISLRVTVEEPALV